MTAPSNLVPTAITDLPVAPAPTGTGTMIIVIGGVTYQAVFNDVLGQVEVPATRSINTGGGLTGGGNLTQDRTLAIANGGVDDTKLSTTGVAAGTYGSATEIPQIVVNAQGRITGVTLVSPSFAGLVPDSRQIIAGTGLSGGGNFEANRTIEINFSNATPQALGSATAGVGTQASRDDHVHPPVNLADANQRTGILGIANGGTGENVTNLTAGAVLYSDGIGLVRQTLQGTVGQILTSDGAGAPYWQTISGTGTVTSVDGSGGTTGLTLTGGPITTSGTLTLGGTLSSANGGTGISSYSAGDLTYYAAGTALSKLAIGSSTHILTSSGTAPQWTNPSTVTVGSATTATNLANGALNQIAYQTGAGATGFITAPTVTDTFLKWDGSAFAWAANPLGTVTSVGGTGTVSGISLSGTVTSSGNLTLGGALDLSAPPAIGGVTPNTATFTTVNATTFDTNVTAAGVTLAGTTLAADGTDTDINVLINTKGTAGVGIDGAPTGTVAGVSVTSKFCVKGDGSQPLAGFVHANNATANSPSIVYACRSRGTIASPAVVQNNDALASFIVAGFDGTDLALAARIDFEVDGTPGSNDMPTRVIIKTTPDGAQAPVEALRINSAQVVTLANALPIASGGTNGTATPTAGAIAYGTGTAYAFNSAGSATEVLTSAGAGAPTWTAQSSLTAGAATNIASGAANQIPYQTGAGATSFITAPTVGDTFLKWNGSAFAWDVAGAGTVTSVTASSPLASSGGSTPDISLTGTIVTTNGGLGVNTFTAGDLVYYSTGTAFSKLAIGVSTYLLTSSGTAPQWSDPSGITVGTATNATNATNATTATNLAGGDAGKIPYQSAAGTTLFSAAGNTGEFLISGGTGSPTWTATISGGTYA